MRDNKCEMGDNECEMRDKNARCEIGRDEPAFAISNLVTRDFSAFRRWQTDQKRLLIILAYKLRGSLLSSLVCVRPSGYGKWSCLYLLVCILVACLSHLMNCVDVILPRYSLAKFRKEIRKW